MPESSPQEAARVETSDIGSRVIWVGVPLLVGTVALLGLLALWLFPGSATDKTLRLPLPVYPAPRLQVDPRADMARFQARELRQLESTGWADREHGIVHMPIEMAMDRIASQGIAGWPAPESPTPAGPVPLHPAAPRPADAGRGKTEGVP